MYALVTAANQTLDISDLVALGNPRRMDTFVDRVSDHCVQQEPSLVGVARSFYSLRLLRLACDWSDSTKL